MLPLACSESTRDDPAGTGGGGDTASGSSGSGGGAEPAGGPTTSGGVGGGEGGTGAGGTEAAGGGMGGGSGEDPLFVPEGLSNTELGGEDGKPEGLTLIAFTLVQGASGLELYAAVKNYGDTPACDASMRVYFVDKAEQLVATWGDSLRTRHLYRLSPSPDVIIPCVAPGEIAMTGSTDLPDEVVLDEIGYLQHAFPAHAVDVVPIDEAVAVTGVEAVSRGAGSAYTGTLENRLDVAVSSAEVTIFPVSRAGRPLGVATSRAEADIPPGGTWSFETTTVSDTGVDYVAYPSVSFPPP